jgi:hypothetical protein
MRASTLARFILAMLLSRTVAGVVNQCHVLDSNKELRYVDWWAVVTYWNNQNDHVLRWGTFKDPVRVFLLSVSLFGRYETENWRMRGRYFTLVTLFGIA